MDAQVILDGVMGGEVLFRSEILKKVAKKNKSKHSHKNRNLDGDEPVERNVNIFGEE
jgi:hypothetical protein